MLCNSWVNAKLLHIFCLQFIDFKSFRVKISTIRAKNDSDIKEFARMHAWYRSKLFALMYRKYLNFFGGEK